MTDVAGIERPARKSTGGTRFGVALTVAILAAASLAGEPDGDVKYTDVIETWELAAQEREFEVATSDYHIQVDGNALLEGQVDRAVYGLPPTTFFGVPPAAEIAPESLRVAVGTERPYVSGEGPAQLRIDGATQLIGQMVGLVAQAYAAVYTPRNVTAGDYRQFLLPVTRQLIAGECRDDMYAYVAGSQPQQQNLYAMASWLNEQTVRISVGSACASPPTDFLELDLQIRMTGLVFDQGVATPVYRVTLPGRAGYVKPKKKSLFTRSPVVRIDQAFAARVHALLETTLDVAARNSQSRIAAARERMQVSAARRAAFIAEMDATGLPFLVRQPMAQADPSDVEYLPPEDADCYPASGTCIPREPGITARVIPLHRDRSAPSHYVIDDSLQQRLPDLSSGTVVGPAALRTLAAHCLRQDYRQAYDGVAQSISREPDPERARAARQRLSDFDRRCEIVRAQRHAAAGSSPAVGASPLAAMALPEVDEVRDDDFPSETLDRLLVDCGRAKALHDARDAAWKDAWLAYAAALQESLDLSGQIEHQVAYIRSRSRVCWHGESDPSFAATVTALEGQHKRQKESLARQRLEAQRQAEQRENRRRIDEASADLKYWVQRNGPGHVSVATSLLGMADVYAEQGDYAKAETLMKDAIAIQEKSLGADALDVARSHMRLANLYLNQRSLGSLPDNSRRQCAKAATPLQRVLEIAEKRLGAGHHEMARLLEYVADIHATNCQDGARAEPLYERALAVREGLYGRDHPDVAAKRSALADHYVALGRYAKAEALYASVRAYRVETLGPDHPDVATSHYDLARFYYYVDGNHARAAPLYAQALLAWERSLGPDKPELAARFRAVADFNYTHGNAAGAGPLYARALAIRASALGAGHLDLLDDLAVLARYHANRGEHARAVPLFQRALGILEGGDDDNAAGVAVASMRDALAAIHVAQQDYAAASALYERTLTARAEALGGSHPEVAFRLDTLAQVDVLRGDVAGARVLYERSLAIQERVYADSPANLLATIEALAAVYMAQREYPGAQALYERALTIREGKVESDQDVDLATALNNLARACFAQRDDARAYPIYARAVAIWEKRRGPAPADKVPDIGELPPVGTDPIDALQAEQVHTRALAVWERARGPEHPDTAIAAYNLAALYQGMGDEVKAVPLYERALAIRASALSPADASLLAGTRRLALLHFRQGNVERSELLSRRALAIAQINQGPHHPDVADALDALALLYRSTSRQQAAEWLAERAAEIRAGNR